VHHQVTFSSWAKFLSNTHSSSKMLRSITQNVIRESRRKARFMNSCRPIIVSSSAISGGYISYSKLEVSLNHYVGKKSFSSRHDLTRSFSAAVVDEIHDAETPFKKLLAANRGEIATRIMRASSELGIPTAGIYAHEGKSIVQRIKVIYDFSDIFETSRIL